VGYVDHTDADANSADIQNEQTKKLP